MSLFRQKIAYSLLLSAFCGYLRSFNLFHPVFPYNRAFAAVLTDFLRFRCVLRFCPFYGSIPYFSCSYEGFIVFCRISPVFSRFFSLHALFYENIGISAAITPFPPLFVYPSCFSRDFEGLLPELNRFRLFIRNLRFYIGFPIILLFSLSLALFCKEKDGISVPPVFSAICTFFYSHRRLSRLLV